MAVFWHRMRGGRTSWPGRSLTALRFYHSGDCSGRTGRAGWARDWMAIAASVIFAGWAGYNGWLLFQFMPSRNDRVVLRCNSSARALIR